MVIAEVMEVVVALLLVVVLEVCWGLCGNGGNIKLMVTFETVK